MSFRRPRGITRASALSGDVQLPEDILSRIPSSITAPNSPFQRHAPQSPTGSGPPGSPNQLRDKTTRAAAEREDFASTMVAMREFCENRRMAKIRADSDLKAILRELPSEQMLSDEDREQLAGLIDKFLFLAVGALSRPVCQELVVELQSIRSRTAAPLVTRVLFAISPVLRRALTDAELTLTPVRHTTHTVGERQESSFLSTLRATESKQEWDATMRRRRELASPTDAGPQAADAEPIAPAPAAVDPSAFAPPMLQAQSRAGSELLLCRVCEQPVSAAEMEEHVTMCMLDMMVFVSVRRIRRALRHVERLCTRVEHACSGQFGWSGSLGEAHQGALVGLSARYSADAARDEGAGSAEGGGAGGSAELEPPPNTAMRRRSGDMQASLQLLYTCRECCVRALRMLDGVDGTPRPHDASRSREAFALLQTELTTLERVDKQELPRKVMRLVIESTEAVAEGAQLAELAGHFLEVFQEAARSGSRPLQRSRSLTSLHAAELELELAAGSIGGHPLPAQQLAPPAGLGGLGALLSTPERPADEQELSPTDAPGAPASAEPAGPKPPPPRLDRSLLAGAEGAAGAATSSDASPHSPTTHLGPLFNTREFGSREHGNKRSPPMRSLAQMRSSAAHDALTRSGGSPLGERRGASPLNPGATAAAPPLPAPPSLPASHSGSERGSWSGSPLIGPTMALSASGLAHSGLGPGSSSPAGAAANSGGESGGSARNTPDLGQRPSLMATGAAAPLGSPSMGARMPGVSRRLLDRHEQRAGMQISISSFEMIKPISRGAYGRVYLAMKRRTGDLYAVKVLSKADTLRKNQLANVTAEQAILASANNPFVVKLFYSFASKQNLYMVMEFVNGGDLYSLLQAVGRLDEGTARAYIAELCLALQYLHEELGVVHRDLKPDNALIDANGHIVLTDFGLSHMGVGDALPPAPAPRELRELRTSVDGAGGAGSAGSLSLGRSDSNRDSNRSSRPDSRAHTPHSRSGSNSPRPASDDAAAEQQSGANTTLAGAVGARAPALPVGLTSLGRTLAVGAAAGAGAGGCAGCSGGSAGSLGHASADSPPPPAAGPPQPRPIRGKVGTPDYMSPEILLGTGHDARVDWWSLGVVLYELLIGVTPFNADSPQGVFEQVLRGQVEWPPGAAEHLSAEAIQLVGQLLTLDPDRRLGTKGAAEVMAHPWFDGVEWDKLRQRERSHAPFVPKLDDLYDTSYFKERMRSARGAAQTSSADPDFTLAPPGAAPAAAAAASAVPAAKPPTVAVDEVASDDSDAEMPGYSRVRDRQRGASSSSSSDDARGARAPASAPELAEGLDVDEPDDFSAFSTFVHLGNLQQVTQRKLADLKRRLAEDSPHDFLSECGSLPVSTAPSPTAARHSTSAAFLGPALSPPPSRVAAGSASGALLGSSLLSAPFHLHTSSKQHGAR